MRGQRNRGVLPLLALACAALLAPAPASAAPVPGDPCPNGDRRQEQAKTVPLVAQLPDCMALEMVSPPQKFNQRAYGATVSADGERVLFQSNAALADTPNLLSPIGGDNYVASRDQGEGGWVISPTTPPGGTAPQSAQSQSFSPDLSCWLHRPLGYESEWQLGIGQIFRNCLGGAIQPLSPVLVPLSGPSGEVVEIVAAATFKGATPNHSRAYFSPGPNREERNVSYLLGDPIPEGVGKDWNTYIVGPPDPSGNPSLTLLARDKDGKAWGGNCGSRLGGIGRTTGTGNTAPNGNRNQGAISPDGKRVYFSARAAQPPTGDCTETPKMRILERTETATGEVEIEQLIASECEREAPEPACATHDGDDLYQGASVDQSKVYFTTNRQLADSDLDGNATQCSISAAVSGCDLYLYDSSKPEGGQLTQVSAGEDIPGHHEEGKEAKVYNSITAISGDGSRVYFAAQGVLTDGENPEGDSATDYSATTPKLYVWEAESEELAFVGALASNDGAANGLFGKTGGTLTTRSYLVPVRGKDGAGKEVGGSGHIFLFHSHAPLTADDTDGAFRDIFRYDAIEHTLERISKAAPGGSDNAPHHVGGEGSAGGTGTDFAENGRWASEDGETVVFTSGDGLLPGDPSGLEDAYLWRDGDLHRLPGTTTAIGAGSSTASWPVISHDGSTVAFTAIPQLLPADGDTINDVYVARARGGFPHVVPQTCAPDGEGGCQGEAAGPAAFAPALAVATGNVTPGRNCSAIAKRARNLSQRAQRQRHQASRAANARRSGQLRRQARRLAKRAQGLQRNVRRCRQDNRRAGK